MYRFIQEFRGPYTVKKILNKVTLNKLSEDSVIARTKADGILVQQKRTELLKELFRKSIHILTVFVPFALRFAYIPTLIALTLVLLVYIVSEILRLHTIAVPLISEITNAAARKRDGHGFVWGPVMLALGVIITAIMFEPQAAQIGITALALGDGLASLAGKFCGKLCIPFTKGKTVAGSFTCFLAIFISTYLITRSLVSAFIIAVIGAIIELIPIKDLDNILIPILLAVLAQVIGRF